MIEVKICFLEAKLEGLADDGKHACSVTEVVISFLEAKLRRGGTVADSGKHANGFSYACEKVQEVSHAQKGEGFGEGGGHGALGGWRIYSLQGSGRNAQDA